jgi:hypothetical protein
MIELENERLKGWLDAPDKLVPAVSDEVNKLGLALHVEDVAPQFDKGQVEKDDCDGARSRVAQDLRIDVRGKVQLRDVNTLLWGIACGDRRGGHIGGYRSPLPWL